MFIRDLLRTNYQEVIVTIDSKGRISIPAFLRKNFYLTEGSKIKLRFNWKYNLILLNFENGQNSEPFVSKRSRKQEATPLLKQFRRSVAPSSKYPENGQSGVSGNIKPCGGSVLGSKDRRLKPSSISRQSAAPGSGPEKERGGKYG